MRFSGEKRNDSPGEDGRIRLRHEIIRNAYTVVTNIHYNIYIDIYKNILYINPYIISTYNTKIIYIDVIDQKHIGNIGGI